MILLYQSEKVLSRIRVQKLDRPNPFQPQVLRIEFPPADFLFPRRTCYADRRADLSDYDAELHNPVEELATHQPMLFPTQAKMSGFCKRNGRDKI
jgi:hypothetical protein